MNKRWTRTPEQRYWDKVEVKGPEECWLWTGSIVRGGYGSIWWHGQSRGSACRVGWELLYGPIPDGLCVCHHYDNPACHNPAHWFLGTLQDNNRDRLDKGRYRKSHHDTPNQKLDWEKVRAIRASYSAGGVTQKQLAERYGVSAGKIWHVIHHRSWREPESL